MLRSLANHVYVLIANFKVAPELHCVAAGKHVLESVELCVKYVEERKYSNRLFRRCLEHGLERLKDHFKEHKKPEPEFLLRRFGEDYHTLNQVIEELRSGNEITFQSSYGTRLRIEAL